MAKFYNTIPEEQETIISIDYKDKKIICYTNKLSIYNKLRVKLGEPNKIYYIKEKISGANWEIPFESKKKIFILFSLVRDTF